MKLITEFQHDQNIKFITESFDKKTNKPPTFILEGIYCKSDFKTGNGRSYPYKLMKREVDKFREEMINTGRALGALEHPDHPEIVPQESAIRILSLEEDNHCWIGKSCILASQPEFHIKGTPNGDLLLSLVQYGTNIGFSTRSLGELNEAEDEVVDMQLCTIDAVANPACGEFCNSNGNRFVNGILESKQWVCDNHGELIERKYNKLEKRLSKLPNTYIKRNKSEYIGKAISDFLNSLV